MGRVNEVVIPIARDQARRLAIAEQARISIETRAKLRTELSSFFGKLEGLLSAGNTESIREATEHAGTSGGQTFLGDRESFVAFRRNSEAIEDQILIPKYYNPKIAAELKSFDDTCNLLTVGQLVESEQISLDTGDEIGRLNYGTGPIPFVRTSDLSTYELKSDSKQGVSEPVYDAYAEDQAVKSGNIILVRDGTYLVGSSAIVFPADLPMLYCGGMYKISLLSEELSPGLLYGLLNLPIVKRQMRSKQFTRDVIDTLGKRLLEVVLPIPRSSKQRQLIGTFVHDRCLRRVSARADLRTLCGSLFASATVV